MPVEFEIKLRIPEARLTEKLMNDPRVLETQKEEFRAVRMESFYYDTPTHELNGLKWALRIRRENGVSVATLKTNDAPVQVEGMFSRLEWQCPAETLEEAIPKLMEQGAPDRLAEIAARSAFVERCLVSFVRQAALLEFAGGTMAEMAIDSGVIEAEGKSETFLELELELLVGDPAPLTAIAAQWEEQYGLTNEHASKYERALRLIRSRTGR